MKSPDEICSEYSGKEVKLKFKKLDEDNILIEGNSESLMFLAQLMSTQAHP